MEHENLIPDLPVRADTRPMRPLGKIANRLLECLYAIEDLGIHEGAVRTARQPSYRRIDCDGRALAYIRVRPKHRCVRVDVSPLWSLPRRSRLEHPRALGRGVLLLRDLDDLAEAIRCLSETVRNTREEFGELPLGEEAPGELAQFPTAG
jgi:hypothetical protein